VEFASHDDQLKALAKYKGTPALLGDNKLDLDMARQKKGTVKNGKMEKMPLESYTLVFFLKFLLFGKKETLRYL